MTIKKWKDIKEDFTDALLMGNGASIEFDKKFTYKSLWEAAKDTGQITDEIDNLAKALHTGTNFELLLNKLSEVINVNNKFDIESDKIKNTHKSILSITTSKRSPPYFCFRAKRGSIFDFAFARSAEKNLILLSREARRFF